MLSMKTLKVAIGTLGSAFLLSAGVANAAVNLSSMPQGSPTLIAAETLDEDLKFRTTSFYSVMTPHDPMCVDATTNVQLFGGDDWFVRLDLDGMRFAKDPAGTFEVLQGFSLQDTDNNAMTPDVPVRDVGTAIIATERFMSVAQGGIGESMAIYRIDLPEAQNVDRMQVLRFLLGNGTIAVTGATGTYGVEVTVWEDLSEARAKTSDSGFGQELISASGTFLEVVNAVNVAVSKGSEATADVAHGFTQFTGAGLSKAVLGSVQVTARSMIGTRNIYDASVAVEDLTDPSQQDGTMRSPEQNARLLVSPDSVLGANTTVTIAGHGTVGNITLLPQVAAVTAVTADPDASPPVVAVEAADARAPTDAECSIAVDDMGEATTNLTGPGDTGTFAGMRYTHEMAGENIQMHLCFDAGAINMMPIPPTTYTAEVGPAYNVGVPMDAREPAGNRTGEIGVIDRNGTSVNLTYLTAHPSYNQRVIIVNRSGQPVEYTLGELVEEDGIEVTTMDAASGTVGAGEKAVIRVDTMLMFEAGNTTRRRAAGTLALNGPKEQISVATTQVNRMDGSTDTVLYESLGVSD